MIAKIIKGTSFSGVLAYTLGKQEGKARILYADGVRANAQASDVANDFTLQASMRPNVKKPVYRTAIYSNSESYLCYRLGNTSLRSQSDP
jgi:mobilization protein